MSNYTKTTNFATKDSLPSGDPNKIVKGAEINTEFDNIATAVATKANSASPTFTGTVTIPTADINGGAIDGTVIGGSTAASVTGTTLTANTSLNIAGDGATVTGIKDEDDMASDSATKLATQQSIKAYVDSQVTAQDLDVTTDSGTISIDLDSETLTVAGGTGLDSSATGNTVTLGIDSTVATLTGTQTLTNKTLTAPVISGNLTTDGTIDGRDVATDGTKLDGIEAGATADQTAAEIRTLVESASDSNVFTDADHSKLNGIEANADVTDTTNVTAAGALMDSEVTNLAQVKAFDSADYATAAQGTTADSALQNVVEDTTPQLGGDLSTNGNDISFGDNDKATFGAGDDIQIYHSGAHSYIDDTGTGSLYIRASNLAFGKPDGTEFFGSLTSDGGCFFKFDNATKLATTSTGIDVTGGVTTNANSYLNGLRVGGADTGNTIYQPTGDLSISSASGSIFLKPSGTTVLTATSTGIDVTGTATMDGLVSVLNSDTQGKFSGWSATGGTATHSGAIELGQNASYQGIISYDAANDTRFIFDNSWNGTGSTFEFRTNTAATAKTHLKIEGSGDISFYEDTGTTPKFFWDASAESLGIGTSSPSAKLTIGGSGANRMSFVGPTGTYYTGYDGATDEFQIASNTAIKFQAGSGYAERMRIDSSGNVGIGTSSPSSQFFNNLVVGNDTAGDKGITIRSNASNRGVLAFSDTDSATDGRYSGFISYDHSDNAMKLHTNGGTERMRIDSSGNLLVGKTSAENTTAGCRVRGDGFASFVRSGAEPALINRLTNDGSLLTLQRDGGAVGSIGTKSGNINIGGGDTGLYIDPANDAIRPWTTAGNDIRDNAINLGTSNARFKDIYRSGSTYSTSDRNKKQDIRDLTDAEARVAVVAKGSLKAFRYIDTVEAEGDDANIHFGIIAQDLKAAFEAEGLNADSYQVLKTATYTDDDGVEQTTYSVCYENLLAFIISGI